MDSFEAIIAKLLEQRGYWTRRNVMVEITKEDKRALDNHSMPRPEIDIIAYSPRDKELLIIECKSYLDSRGVGMWAFDPHRTKTPKAITLFVNDQYRQLITDRLIGQMKESGLLAEEIVVRYGLVCGNAIEADISNIKTLFTQKDWLLWLPADVARQIRSLASLDYENNLATMIAKLLGRNKEEPNHGLVRTGDPRTARQSAQP